MGRTKEAFRNLNKGKVMEFNFKKTAEATKLIELTTGGADCLRFCGQQLMKEGRPTGSFQVTEGKYNADKWMCRCFRTSNKRTKKQIKRPSMVGKINCQGK